MEEDRIYSYYEIIHKAIVAKNVSDLTLLYKASYRMKEHGRIARYLIDSEIPSLAVYHGVVVKPKASWLIFDREYRAQVLGIKSRREARTPDF